MLNVGQAIQWAFADGLGVTPKAEPEIIVLAILILRTKEKNETVWRLLLDYGFMRSFLCQMLMNYTFEYDQKRKNISVYFWF